MGILVKIPYPSCLPVNQVLLVGGSSRSPLHKDREEATEERVRPSGAAGSSEGDNEGKETICCSCFSSQSSRG